MNKADRGLIKLMYTLYGYNGSGSAAVEMALQASDGNYQVVDVASWEPATPIAELTALNPLTQIPTLVLPDGVALSESAAILIWLAERYPGTGIISADSRVRARTFQGLLYLAANCYAAVGIIDFPERWTSSGNMDEHELIRKGTRARLYYLWEVFADTFKPTPYLSGENPGILDFYAVTICRMFSANKHLKQSRPEFFGFINKLEKHPLLAEIVNKHWPEK